MTTWIVIPAHNEAETIEGVIRGIKKYLKRIVVVDDCSTDATAQYVKKTGVVYIKNTTQLGYTKTLEKGIKKAFALGAEYVITFDADGEHRHQNIPVFLRTIEQQKPDLILGKRDRKNRAIEYLIGFYTQVIFGFADPFCGMKAYPKKTFRKWRHLEDDGIYSIATQLSIRAVKSGCRFVELPVLTKKRIDQSRFATQLRGNWLELQAFWNMIHTQAKS